MHEKFGCLGILLVLPACALENAVLCALCVCGGVPCAIAAAGTNPVTVSGAGCHTSVTSPSRISLSLTLHDLPTGELIYCTVS